MKKILIDIASAIVDKPEEVVVNERMDADTLHLELSVAPDDMGKVIGKGGRIAKAIRTVMKASSTKNNQHVVVDIVEKNG
ncbi:MAG: KH domain-containing protein [Ruminococcaceae bacterium]|nr:KH domain-containing protein [Oscillospiraceae bacterium]